MNGWLILILAAVFILGLIAGGTWVATRLRSGPGPRSRLERLLAEHERDEERRTGSSEEGAA